MRIIVKQLYDIIDSWSRLYPIAGAVIELPSIFRAMNNHIDTSFTSAEINHLYSIKNLKRRASHIAGRFAVRNALQKLDSCTFSCSSNASPEILNNNHGKPYLTKHNDINVSISHSGSLAVAIVSYQNIGIDIEKTEERPDSFIRCYFQKSEQNWINMNSINKKQRINYLWTRKEAVSKLLGVGGAISFRELQVLDNKSNLFFYSHDLNSYCISLAIQHGHCI